MGAHIEINSAGAAFTEDFFAPVATDKVSMLVGEYRAVRAKIESVSAFMQSESAGVLTYFIEGNRDEDQRSTFGIDSLFEAAGAIAALNASFWSRTLHMTDVLDLMPQARRTEWNNLIRQHKTPDFEEETVRTTLLDLLSSRATFFAERVDGVFRILSGSHVTNQPEGFSKRAIIENVLDKFGYTNHEQVGYINDFRCVVARFMGRDEPRWNSTSRVVQIALAKPGKWITLDGGAMQIRVYKKGTAHLEVHPDMAWRLNAVLASLYPTAIPSRFRKQPKKAPKAFAVMTQALPFPVVDVLADVLKDHRGGTMLKLPFSGLSNNKELRKNVVAVIEMIGGSSADGYRFEFDYEPAAVLEELVATGVVPEQRSHQFYPTREVLAQQAIDEADIGDEHDCLEPSAGTGGLAQYMPKDRTLCVEISKLHSKVLKAKGFQVETADFLAWADKTSKRFDRIVMNPPFADGRAKLHLEAAAGLLRDGGRLVAILPGSMRGKDLLSGFDCEWRGPFADQFEGTGVSVVMLVAQKK